jgi:hypothetical protein
MLFRSFVLPYRGTGGYDIINCFSIFINLADSEKVENSQETIMNQDAPQEKSIFDLQGLVEIKKRPDILTQIKLDVTPRMVMEPRFQANREDLKKLQAIAGYMFYVESQCNPPALMLLKVGRTDITNSIGRIDEVPQELLEKAITNPPEQPSHGMYAITDEIREWLKKQLDLQ